MDPITLFVMPLYHCVSAPTFTHSPTSRKLVLNIIQKCFKNAYHQHCDYDERLRWPQRSHNCSHLGEKIFFLLFRSVRSETLEENKIRLFVFGFSWNRLQIMKCQNRNRNSWFVSFLVFSFSFFVFFFAHTHFGNEKTKSILFLQSRHK